MGIRTLHVIQEHFEKELSCLIRREDFCFLFSGGSFILSLIQS